MDNNVEVFVTNISSLVTKMAIYLAKKAQIFLLFKEKITIPIECLVFADVFMKKLVEVLIKYTGANQHLIILKNGK